MINLEKSGEIIRALFKTKYKTLKEVSNRYGVSVATISHWQMGRVLPSIDNLVEIADDFGVKVDDLIAREYLNDR